MLQFDISSPKGIFIDNKQREGIKVLIIIIAYIIMGIIYMACPKYLKFVACVINMMVPDPIPGIDEVVMIAGLFA